MPTHDRTGASGTSLRRLCRFLIVVPPIVLVVMVARYGFDAPYQDTWEFVPVLQKSYEGTLSLQNLWTQHNEHRLFFPRLIMLGLARLTSWNLRYELAITLLCATGTFVCLASLWRATTREVAGKPSPWVLPLVSLLVFSLNQWHVWLWGWLLQITLNILVTVAGISILSRSDPKWSRFVLACALGFVATHSFAAGLLFWPVGLFLVAAVHPADRKETAIRLATWTFVAATAYVSYFVGYEHTLHRTTYVNALQNMPSFFCYVLAYLGAPLINYTVWGAFAVGLAGLVLLVLLTASLIRTKAITLSALSRYLALALFAMGNACMAGIGRAVDGPKQALSSRYAAFSTLFWVALVVLFALWRQTRRDEARSTLRRVLRSLPALTLLALLVLSSAYGAYKADEHWDAFQIGRAALTHNGPDQDLHWLYPDPSIVRARREVLIQYHLSIFSVPSLPEAQRVAK